MSEENVVLVGVVMAFGIPAAILIYAFVLTKWRW